ncbi:Uncharacterized protein dnm_099210 [Desulfonema magnum]|uniref:Uncharacterized protein n=1 Tax=Desulfonema magnum TaxID=45655 RepID=A0A975BZQ1_9BACT|nr:Uncharacterized protein dnm_099210 [Desulfonema magnum]
MKAKFSFFSPVFLGIFQKRTSLRIFSVRSSAFRRCGTA